jgi:hypothetical protein
MDVKELRIGNCVSMNRKIVFIDVRIFHAIIHGFIMYNANPVPLTDEWKEKLKDAPIFMDKEGFIIFKNSYNYAFVWDDYPFLHQLQNLYFELTREELIFKI